ncbi:MAG: hypothetical protein R3A48_14755 [Polyangiales bacterium]
MKTPRRTVLALGLIALAPAVAAQTDMSAMVRESASRLVERGEVEERAGHALRAEGFYLRALSVDRALVSASLGAARLLDARGRREEARRLLREIPRRAFEGDAARVAVSRALHAVGDDDAALALLRSEVDSGPALRERVSLCAGLGRFPEALAAARRWSLLPNLGDGERREARVTVRALERLVAELDAVRYAPGASTLRRLLPGR